LKTFFSFARQGGGGARGPAVIGCQTTSKDTFFGVSSSLSAEYPKKGKLFDFK